VVRGCRQLIRDGEDVLAGKSHAEVDRRHGWREMEFRVTLE